VVLVRLLYGIIFAETLVGCIVGMIYTLSLPVLLALDAEVVIRATSEVTITAIRLKNTLCKGDAGGDAIAFHMVYGYLLILLDVLLLCLACLC
jgi:hypothetical protein